MLYLKFHYSETQAKAHIFVEDVPKDLEEQVNDLHTQVYACVCFRLSLCSTQTY
jgi:hypothetical protein